MNIQSLLPLVTQITGKDWTAEAHLFIRSRESFGRALGAEGQKFVLGHWRHLADFLESEAGQKAATEFTNAWAISLYPQLTPPPKPDFPKVEVPELPQVDPEPPAALFGS